MSVDLHATVRRRLVASSSVVELAGASLDVLTDRIDELVRLEAPLLSDAHHRQAVAEIAAAIRGLGPLEPLLADPAVTEIMLNGPTRAFVERAGRLEPIELGLDESEIVRLVERVLGPLGLRVDRASPIVDARLADGSRLHAVLPPLALDGPYVTIRRFGARAVPASAFGIGPDALEFLTAALEGGWNLLVAGGTSTGKTTLLNALAATFASHERIVTLEETAELRLPAVHLVRLEARPANAEGAGEVSMRALLRAALRMRPDRIVVGEVRGPEALDLLQALNTGHDGSLSTVHASSATGALARIETLALLGASNLSLEAVRTQVHDAIDAVVRVARLDDGIRVVTGIAEVQRTDHGLVAHTLWQRRGAELVPVRAASRPLRRARRRAAS